MSPKAPPPFARRLAAVLGAAALAAGLSACGSDDGAEPASGEAEFRAQDCPRVEPTGEVSVEEAMGWGDARRDIQEQEMRCATEADLEHFFENFSEPAAGVLEPEPTRSPERASGGGLPGFSVAAVDAAADGSLETKPIERNSEDYDLPALLPTPGISVGFKAATGWQACTLSFLGERAGELVGVTAGHCSRDSVDGRAFWKPGGAGDPTALGTFASDYCYDYDECGDYGAVSVDSSLSADGKIAGKYPVSGVMDPADLDQDTELCKYGRVSGESCGRFMGSEGAVGRAGIDTREGDSGAPVYRKNRDGTVDLVGLHGSSPEGSDGRPVDAVSDFTFAAPAIAALGIDRVL